MTKPWEKGESKETKERRAEDLDLAPLGKRLEVRQVKAGRRRGGERTPKFLYCALDRAAEEEELVEPLAPGRGQVGVGQIG